MVIRLTHFNVTANNADEVKKIYNQEVLPEIKKQKGNTNAMLLFSMDGSEEFISETIWQDQASADIYESSGKYYELVAKIKALIGTPVLKSYTA